MAKITLTEIALKLMKLLAFICFFFSFICFICSFSEPIGFISVIFFLLFGIFCFRYPKKYYEKFGRSYSTDKNKEPDYGLFSDSSSSLDPYSLIIYKEINKKLISENEEIKVIMLFHPKEIFINEYIQKALDAYNTDKQPSFAFLSLVLPENERKLNSVLYTASKPGKEVILLKNLNKLNYSFHNLESFFSKLGLYDLENKRYIKANVNKIYILDVDSNMNTFKKDYFRRALFNVIETKISIGLKSSNEINSDIKSLLNRLSSLIYKDFKINLFIDEKTTNSLNSFFSLEEKLEKYEKKEILAENIFQKILPVLKEFHEASPAVINEDLFIDKDYKGDLTLTFGTKEYKLSEVKPLDTNNNNPKDKMSNPNTNKANKPKFDLEEELNKIIGLDSIKRYIRELNMMIAVNKERKKHGFKIPDTQTLHMVFKGNPGTGKTMIARTIANMLYQTGVIKTNKLIETDRAGLVGEYIGQTEIKTMKVITSAFYGVLFIDEAYSLNIGDEKDYGLQAINILVKMMDDHRDKLVVILAGYNEEMDKLLSSNPGLKSRFPNIVNFPDYDSASLVEIANIQANNQQYFIEDDAKNELKRIFDKEKEVEHFGNGRYVRNFIEKAIRQQNIRLGKEKDFSEKSLISIKKEDILSAYSHQI